MPIIIIILFITGSLFLAYKTRKKGETKQIMSKGWSVTEKPRHEARQDAGWNNFWR